MSGAHALLKEKKNDWFAIYLGRANNLRERFKAYINADGTFGPKKEAFKYNALCNLFCKGFDLQIRWRRKRFQTCIIDEAKKLAKYDFCLNRQDNGGYREIMVPIPQNPIMKLFGISNKSYWSLSDPRMFPQRRQLPAAPRFSNDGGSKARPDKVEPPKR
eukprot:jgi/Botrbrau1/1947/Bobra.0005s0039.1